MLHDDHILTLAAEPVGIYLSQLIHAWTNDRGIGCRIKLPTVADYRNYSQMKGIAKLAREEKIVSADINGLDPIRLLLVDDPNALWVGIGDVGGPNALLFELYRGGQAFEWRRGNYSELVASDTLELPAHVGEVFFDWRRVSSDGGAVEWRPSDDVFMRQTAGRQAWTASPRRGMRLTLELVGKE